MAQVIITINNREYSIACGDGQEGRILQLARMVDEKAKSLGAGASQIAESSMLAMTCLLLADDMSENGKANSVPTFNFSELDKKISDDIKSIISKI